MADVRSLLRQQRAARQQAKHPKQSPAPAAAPISKKRKAADSEPEGRKRTRTEEEAGVPAGFFDAGPTDEEDSLAPITSNTAQGGAVPLVDDVSETLDVTRIQAHPGPPADAELDAFMDEMDQEAAVQHNTATIYSGAVIEAAPMTAAELAAQAREELSSQRAKRDEEMEGEKEDAARALEDEFDEMEGLEERVKKLRDQREALRRKHVEAMVEDIALPTPQPEEESDSEDEDWDDWRFRPA